MTVIFWLTLPSPPWRPSACAQSLKAFAEDNISLSTFMQLCTSASPSVRSASLPYQLQVPPERDFSHNRASPAPSSLAGSCSQQNWLWEGRLNLHLHIYCQGNELARVKFNWLNLIVGVCCKVPIVFGGGLFFFFFPSYIALKNYRNFMMCYWSSTGRDYSKGVKVGLC